MIFNEQKKKDNLETLTENLNFSIKDLDTSNIVVFSESSDFYFLNEGIDFKKLKTEIKAKLEKMWKAFVKWVKDIFTKMKNILKNLKKKKVNSIDNNQNKMLPYTDTKSNRTLELPYTDTKSSSKSNIGMIKIKNKYFNVPDSINQSLKSFVKLMNNEKYTADDFNGEYSILIEEFEEYKSANSTCEMKIEYAISQMERIFNKLTNNLKTMEDCYKKLQSNDIEIDDPQRTQAAIKYFAKLIEINKVVIKTTLQALIEIENSQN